MSAFRYCCRHPRASSPGLPNVQLVPSPTQDVGYDADAVRIPTPTATLVGSLHPTTTPDEPRPSSDTIVHHEVTHRAGKKVDDQDDEGVSQPETKPLRVQRLSSINVPHRRSHGQLQPLPLTFTAAVDHYVKISPSRIALRKRLKAVEVIDVVEGPASPKLEPARIASIPESAITPQWRLSYRENSASFRRPGLKEIGVNKRQKGVSGGSGSQSASLRTKTESEIHQDKVPETVSATLENQRHPSDEVPMFTDAAESHVPSNRGATASGEYGRTPGSYHSDSAVSSVHLYDMHISERVASSNSNILSMAGSSLGRRRASTTESNSMLPMGMSRYQRDRQSSSLESPKESSSVYSSNEDDLASSRRSSIRLIEGLPERIQRLKSHVTTGDLYASSAQHSQITVIPRSRFRLLSTRMTSDRRHIAVIQQAMKETLGNSRRTSHIAHLCVGRLRNRD